MINHRGYLLWQILNVVFEANSWWYAGLEVTIGDVLRSRPARRSVAQLSGGVSIKSASAAILYPPVCTMLDSTCSVPHTFQIVVKNVQI